jgi:hypothetical protein
MIQSYGTDYCTIFSILLVRVSLYVFQVNDKGNAVIGTRYGRLNGMFVANEMSICKQDLILFRRSASSEKNIGLTVVPKDIQFLIVLFLHIYFSALFENVVIHERRY